MIENPHFVSDEAFKPVLLNDLDENALRQNVSKILEELHKNTYKDSTPAKLVAVTKTVSAEIVNRLEALQVLDIAENRVQVATEKMTKIAPDFRLHWIGRLQRNKVKYIIDTVHMLHTM